MPNSIIKDKNIITITIDHNGTERTYTLDINRGRMENSRGREISVKPQGFISANYAMSRELQEFRKSSVVIGYLLNRVQHNYMPLTELYKYLPIAEKIDALGNEKLGRSFENYECLRMLALVNDTIGLKRFLQWAKEKGYNFNRYEFNSFIREIELYSLMPKEKIEKLDKFAKDIIFDMSTRIKAEIFSKHYQRVLYYIENDAYIKFAKSKDSFRDLVYIFCDIIKFATALECEIPKSKNIFETYNMLQKNYIVWKDMEDNKALAVNQNKDYLNFAYGNYVVVVPTTAEEFRKEAFEQNNCVYNTYLRYVVEGSTNIVFIRKADRVDKSFITCEVEPNGQITQYLLAHNRRVEDSELLELKNLYQNHILNNINK